MKRLAVFDLDGTLVDSRASISAAVHGAWTALGLSPPDYEQSRRVIGLSLHEALKVLAPDLPPARYPELAEAYRAAFIANRAAGADEPLYAGARAAIEALQREGWLLGVATGKGRRGIEHAFTRHGIGDFFSAAFCADDGPGKPDPHMLNLNMSALGVAAAQTVMIGDTSFDMEMARAAGAYGLGVAWGFHTPEEVSACADELVHDFDALIEALRLWRAHP